MFNLLPNENWEYSFKDIYNGTIAALSFKRRGEIIYIPGLGNCIPTRAARVGIIAALKALKLPKNARIGVPL